MQQSARQATWLLKNPKVLSPALSSSAVGTGKRQRQLRAVHSSVSTVRRFSADLVVGGTMFLQKNKLVLPLSFLAAAVLSLSYYSVFLSSARGFRNIAFKCEHHWIAVFWWGIALETCANGKHRGDEQQLGYSESSR